MTRSRVTINFEVNLRQVSYDLMLDSEIESDQNIQQAMLNNQAYEAEVSNIFMRVLNPGDMVIDVGANVGWFTLLAAALVKNNGHVVAFEPAAANTAKIKENVELNGFQSHVRLIQNPVSDKHARTSFYLNPWGNGGHALWDMQETPSESIETTTQKLDDFFTASHVRLLKVDTEGHEHRVLVGAENMIRDRRVDYVVCEFHPLGLSKFGDSQESLRTFMDRYGYDTYLLVSGACAPIRLTPEIKLSAQYIQNFLFMRNDLAEELEPIIKLSI